MALLGTRNVAAVAAALAIIFQPKVQEQVNRSCVALNLLPFAPGEGQNLQWDAVFGDPTAATYTIADGADVTVYNSDDVQPAVLQWGTYSEAFAVTGKAMAAARAAKSPDDLASLFEFDMMRAINRLTKGINKDIYTGAGTTNIIGGLITAGAIGATGTYAGIVRGTYSQWASTVSANGSVNRALTFDLMRATITSIYVASGQTPDLILCPPALHDAYGALFGPQRRYVDQINVAGRTITLDAGYKALEFDGIPVVKDVDCPANTMVFVNSSAVRMRQLGDAATSANRAAGTVQLSGTAESQLGAKAARMTARINPLAVTGDAFKVQLILYPQLQVQSPNTCGLLKDVQ